MSVDQPKVIDFIGVDNSTGDVVLTVSDHLDWKDSGNHQLLLQAKINSYLSFIESGEILESYPDSKGRRTVISVIGKHTPDAGGKEFLENVKTAVEEAGFGFQFRLYADSDPA